MSARDSRIQEEEGSLAASRECGWLAAQGSKRKNSLVNWLDQQTRHELTLHLLHFICTFIYIQWERYTIYIWYIDLSTNKKIYIWYIFPTDKLVNINRKKKILFFIKKLKKCSFKIVILLNTTIKVK